MKSQEKSLYEIALEQKDKDREKMGLLQDAYERGLIDKEFFDLFSKYFKDGMGSYRELFKAIYSVYKMPNIIYREKKQKILRPMVLKNRAPSSKEMVLKYVDSQGQDLNVILPDTNSIEKVVVGYFAVSKNDILLSSEELDDIQTEHNLVISYRTENNELQRIVLPDTDDISHDVNNVNIDKFFIKKDAKVNPVSYLENITPETSMVMEFPDGHGNYIHIVMPGMKKVQTAIRKSVKYVQEYRQKISDYEREFGDNKEVLAKKLSELPTPVEKFNDLLRCTVSVKYYRDVKDVVQKLSSSMLFSVDKKKSKDGFKGLQLRFDDPKKGRSPKHYMDNKLYLQLANGLVAEVQIKIGRLKAADDLTHDIYEKEREAARKLEEHQDAMKQLKYKENKDNSFLKSKIMSPFERIEQEFILLGAKLDTAKINQTEGIAKHNIYDVLDKVKRIEDGCRFIGVEQEKDGTYAMCKDFIKENYLPRSDELLNLEDPLPGAPEVIKEVYWRYLMPSILNEKNIGYVTHKDQDFRFPHKGENSNQELSVYTEQRDLQEQLAKETDANKREEIEKKLSRKDFAAHFIKTSGVEKYNLYVLRKAKHMQEGAAEYISDRYCIDPAQELDGAKQERKLPSDLKEIYAKNYLEIEKKYFHVINKNNNRTSPINFVATKAKGR